MVVLAVAALSWTLLAAVGLCACVVSGQADDRAACEYGARDGSREHEDCISRAA